MSRAAHVVCALLLALVASVVSPLPAKAEEPGATEPPLFIVLDVSDSMNEGTPSRLAKAKEAAYQLMADLPSGQQVTLLTYPGGGRTIEGCPAGIVQYGPARLNVAELSAKVRGMSADGGTPIGPALLYVKSLFEDVKQPNGTVVLFSDGEANCGRTDVCEVARSMNDSGLSLMVNTIGLQLNDEGRQQLGCIADATGGKSIQIGEDDDFLEALRQASLAQLGVSVDVSDPFTAVTGGRDLYPGENQISVRVSARGAHTAKNVRVIATVTDLLPNPGGISITRPIRYLGNLAPDADQRTVTFDARPPAGTTTLLRWRVRVTADNAATVTHTDTVDVVTSDDRASAGPLLADAKRAVVLGDSYSSGEGAGGYDADDDRRSGAYACHRSKYAWGRLLFSTDLPFFGTSPTAADMIACSGAKVTHLYNQQHPDIDSQLAALSKLAREDNPPDLVMLTLGGNDVGFGEFVSTCVQGGAMWDDSWSLQVHPCGADADPQDPQRFARFGMSTTLRPTLATAYESIHTTINSPDAIARRGGRVAQILVLPYPNPLPPWDQITDGCFTGLSKLEASTAVDFLERLNGLVRAAVSDARSVGIPIHIADPVEHAFQRGHTLCDADSAIVKDDVLFRATAGSHRDTRPNQATMHPNLTGTRLIAQTLVEWSRTEPVDWTTTPDLTGPAGRPGNSISLGPVANWASDLVGLQEQGGTLGSCNTMFSSAQCLLLADYDSVSIVVRSEPRFLGARHPMWDEDALKGISLPPDLPTGTHELALRAIATDREPLELTRTIPVVPATTGISLLLVACGVVLLASAGVWALAHRVQARRPTGQQPSGQQP